MPRTGPLRLAHVVSNPIQYFAPLYRELATRPEIDLTVYFASDFSVREYQDPGFGRPVTWDVPLLEGYAYELLPSAQGRHLDGAHALYKPSFDVIDAIVQGGFDFLWMHGYANANVALALLRTRLGRRPQLLLRDEPILGHSRASWRRALKYPMLRGLFSRTAGLYIGERNRRYLLHYGADPDRIFPARYCVDNAFFQRQAEELSPQRTQLRAEFGIGDDQPVFLFSGKFVDKKRPLETIQAFAQLRGQRWCWLLMVGDGELKAEAERLVADRGIPDVLFPGFLNQTELARAYVASDAFVLFSSDFETWGLVVNEAMNFSLPIVVSEKVGCSEDLVHGGANGYVVPSDDVKALSRAMGDLIQTPERIRQMGTRSRAIVGEYSIQRCAEGIVKACQALAPPA